MILPLVHLGSEGYIIELISMFFFMVIHIWVGIWKIATK
jgi:hypothetical protein